ncbi:hypothetical protein ABZ338_22275 [Streptomyces albidoflavus]|uniref:hypothetical protein n=1 Tax=Streptomyces albidoflavus TaxID=1886 RepID=UPI0033CD8435
MDTPTARFRDPRSTVYDFLDLVLVRCPGCAGAARVLRALDRMRAGVAVERAEAPVEAGGA